MKILVMNDPHIRGTNPCSRLDNYYQSWLLKFDEILSLSKDCDFIICSGDFFHSPIVSNAIVDDVLDRIDANGTYIYFLFGNHALVNANLEASGSTSLAHMLRRSKYVKYLNELNYNDCYIKGYEYSFGIEAKIKKEGLISNSDKFSIAVTHCVITEKPFFANVSQVLMKDIKSDFDLVICSHIHTNVDTTINKTRFINFNCIGRTSIAEQHIPQVGIIDTKTKSVEFIPLKLAKKVEEIFDLTKYEELKENEKSIDEFLESLENVELQAMDITQQIAFIAKEQNVDKKVIDYLLNKIGEINE